MPIDSHSCKCQNANLMTQLIGGGEQSLVPKTMEWGQVWMPKTYKTTRPTPKFIFLLRFLSLYFENDKDACQNRIPQKSKFLVKTTPKNPRLRFFQCTKTCNTSPKQVYLLQIWYIAPKHVKNDQNI